ncbi:hypothetical protein F2P79_017897, partial [Pimephales promelas]
CLTDLNTHTHTHGRPYPAVSLISVLTSSFSPASYSNRHGIIVVFRTRDAST